MRSLLSVLQLLLPLIITAASLENNLKSWILINGGYINRNIITCKSIINNHHQQQQQQQQQQGLCLNNSTTLNANEIIAVIPSRILITTKTAIHYSRTAHTLYHKWTSISTTATSTSSSATLKTPVTKTEHIMLQRMLLAVFLLEQVKLDLNASFSPYVKSLPSSVSHLPLFWSKKKLIRGLQNSLMTDVLINVRTLIEQGYIDGICPIVPSFCTTFTKEEYLWAIGTVRSRAFERTEDDSLIMIPFGDVLNHNASPSVSWKLDTNGSIVLRSLSTLKKDTELSITYGTLDASKLLSTYGFAHNISVWKATLLVPQDKQSNTPSSAYQLTTEIDTQAISLIHFVCNKWSPFNSIHKAIKRLNTLIKTHMTVNKSDNSRDDGNALYYAKLYRAGEYNVLDYWKNLTEISLSRLHVSKTNATRQRFYVGNACYLLHGNDFRLVRIIAERSANLFDVQFANSGTKILFVQREQLLDESSYLEYICSI